MLLMVVEEVVEVLGVEEVEVVLEVEEVVEVVGGGPAGWSSSRCWTLSGVLGCWNSQGVTRQRSTS